MSGSIAHGLEKIAAWVNDFNDQNMAAKAQLDDELEEGEVMEIDGEDEEGLGKMREREPGEVSEK